MLGVDRPGMRVSALSMLLLSHTPTRRVSPLQAPGTLVDRSPIRLTRAEGVPESYQRPETRSRIIPGSAEALRGEGGSKGARPASAVMPRRAFKSAWPPADISEMKWLKKRKDDARTGTDDQSDNHEEKLMSRMRALSSTKFDDPDEVEARIRRMSYGARKEHRPSWMAVDEWEQRDTA